MNQNLENDIQLRFVFNFPGQSGPNDVLSNKAFAILFLGALFWLTQKLSLVDQTIILVGVAVVPLSAFLYIKSLRPLTLFANGDISVPSVVGPQVTLVKKNEIKSFADMPQNSIALIDENEKLLVIVRPSSFKKSEIFHRWFAHHYGNLPKTTISSKNYIIRPEKQQIGSMKFLIIVAILLGVVAYNIYLAVTGSSY